MTSTIIVYKCSRQNASYWFLVRLSFSLEKSPIDISNEDFLLPFQMFVNACIQYNIRIKSHLTFKWCSKDAGTRCMELQIKYLNFRGWYCYVMTLPSPKKYLSICNLSKLTKSVLFHTYKTKCTEKMFWNENNVNVCIF